jgi:hypothetical protein
MEPTTKRPELLPLTLDTIHQLHDPDKAFQIALQRAVKDCIDRPSDERSRKVTLQINLTPVKEVIDNVISCEGAHGLFQVRCKIPDWETRTYDFGVRTNGALVFNPDSPGNHRQKAFDLEE